MNPNNHTTDLGNLKGPLLIFGGAYSNLQAVEALIQQAEKRQIPPTNIICTGDVVGYCAQPSETIERISKWGIQVIAGNVEQQLGAGENDCGCDFRSGSRCDNFSQNWYPFAKSRLTTAQLEWCNSLPNFLTFNYAGKKVAVVHGSHRETAEYIFKSTPWSYKEELIKELGVAVVLAGHCGLPFHHMANDLYWLNSGVIGMPANDGTSRVWYMFLDDAKGFSFQHQSLEYNNEKAAQLMEEHNLPIEYAQTLLTGLWDNCEILPKEETKMQNVPILHHQTFNERH